MGAESFCSLYLVCFEVGPRVMPGETRNDYGQSRESCARPEAAYDVRDPAGIPSHAGRADEDVCRWRDMFVERYSTIAG